MKQIILSFCLLLCCRASAQHIYGRMTPENGPTSYVRFNPALGTFTPTGNMARCDMLAATSNLTDKYYFAARTCHNAPTYSDFYLYTYDIAKAPTQVFVKNEFALLEYDDGLLWGIDLHSNSLQQVKPDDGHTVYYDDVFKDPSWNMYAPVIYSSAFNHDKKILYFTCANAADMKDVYFYQYDIAARQLTRQPLPYYTITFDYSQLNDRAYFLCGNTPGQPVGISEYNITTNTFTSVYANSNIIVPWSTSVTIDPVKNRLYFQQYQNTIGQCTDNLQACYHINSRQMDIYDMSGKTCSFDYMEYMATDATDTTWDDFPLNVPQVINAAAIQVHPNPASNMINVSYAGNGRLRVSNMQGSTMYLSTFSNAETINTSQWPAGIYLMQFTDNKGMITTRKIAKQ